MRRLTASTLACAFLPCCASSASRVVSRPTPEPSTVSPRVEPPVEAEVEPPRAEAVEVKPVPSPSPISPECVEATRNLAWDFAKAELSVERVALVGAPHFPVEGNEPAKIEDVDGRVTSTGLEQTYDRRYRFWLGLSDTIGVGHVGVSASGEIELRCAGRFDCEGVGDDYASELTKAVAERCTELPSASAAE